MYLCVNIVILLVVMMVRTQCMEDEDEGYNESPAESQKDVKYGEQL